MDLRRYRRILYRLLINRNYRFLRRLKVFDSGYYLENCRAGVGDPADPLWDYLKLCGSDYRDLLDGGRWQQQPDPHPLFDTAWYLLRYFPDGLQENPLVHYLRNGWRQGLWPGPFLSPETYENRSSYNPEAGDPLTHYTHVGAAEGVSPSPYFDVPYYLDWNPVLRDFKSEIIKHYKLYGARNLRSPIPVFDPSYYLSQLEEPEASKMDPLSSYLTMSDRQQCDPGPWFKPGRYRVAAGLDQKTEPLAHYLNRHHDRQHDNRPEVAELSDGPLISVLVPVYNPDIEFLDKCVSSVLHQVYPKWELCLADDGSTNTEVHARLRYWADKDVRIKVVFRPENGGISRATNSAAALAEGDYFGFLDNDDELSLDCLLHVADQISRTGAPILYTDEDLIGNDGTRFSIFHKPDFNLGLLFSHNYITHFVVVDKSLFQESGGFDPQYDGSQDYDLMLRLTEHSNHVLHIPRVLYHWRASKTSTSINHEQKSYAHEAGKKALSNTIARRGIKAHVEDSGTNFFYRVRYDRIREPEVTIVAPCLPGKVVEYEAMLRKSLGYSNCTLQIIPFQRAGEGGKETGTPSGSQGSAAPGEPGMVGTGLAGLMHNAVAASSGEYLAFLTAHPVSLSTGWLEELLSPLLQGDDLGIVCGRIDSDGEPIESYVLPDLGNNTTEYFCQFLAKCTRHLNWPYCSQYVSFCDWDICMIKRTLYDELGGFDHKRYPTRMAMLDLCLKASEQGWKMLYTPHALAHVEVMEQETKQHDTLELRQEKLQFQGKWGAKLSEFDEYFNPGLLGDNGVDPETFMHWLCGNSEQRKG